jgi:hypothetical protein
MARTDVYADVKRQWRVLCRSVRGQSGTEYQYWIHRIGTYFSDEPGNYIYAKEVEPDVWQPVYIGHTSSLEDRLADDEKEACARRHGATHVHVHTTPGGEARRAAEEADLIARWTPACNGHGDPRQDAVPT